MKSYRQWLGCGAAALGIALGGCGGGGDDSSPTALPESVSISTTAPAEVDVATAFTTNIDGKTDGLRFAWTFGDGASASDATPKHAYAKGGDFDVELTVTNEAGASRSAKLVVTASRKSLVRGTVCSGKDEQGWCWQRPKPIGNPINDVFFLDATQAWAVGDAGSILHSSDGGITWTAQASGVTARLTSVGFFDRLNGWAIGAPNTIVHTADGGTTWTAQATGSWLWDYSSVIATGPTSALIANAYAASQQTSDAGMTWTTTSAGSLAARTTGTLWWSGSGGLYRSTDLGKTLALSLPLNGVPQWNVAFADDLRGLVVQYDYGYESTPRVRVWRTTDGGLSWQASQTSGLPDYVLPGLYGLALSADGHGALSTGAGSYGTADNGATWFPIVSPGTWFTAQGVFDSRTFWSIDSNGAAHLTRDQGATWATLAVPNETTGVSKLQVAPDGALWLVYGDRRYRSGDHGATWQRVLGQEAAENQSHVLALWFTDAKHGLAYASDGWLLDTGDGGQTWSRHPFAGVNTWNPAPARIQFADPKTGWITTGGSFARTTDGGASWSQASGPSSLIDFRFIDTNRGWAVDGSNAIWRTSDGGLSWSRLASVTPQLRSIAFVDASVGVAVGDLGSILRTEDGGMTWSARASGTAAQLWRVVFVGKNDAWAIGVNGTVVKSSDAGKTWAPVPVPASAALNDIHFADAKHGWIVGEAGTVLATVDGGDTWKVQASGTRNNLISAHFIDPRSGWIGGSSGAILATATGGK